MPVPLVFLHGLLLDSRVWGDPSRAFGLKAPVSCLDLKGHGARADVRGALDLDAVAADLGPRLPNAPILVGWSFGASVAMRLAADGAGLAGLVLVGATPQLARDRAFRHGQSTGAQRLRDRVMREDYAAALRTFAEQTTGEAEMAEGLLALMRNVPQSRAEALFAAAATDTLLPDLARIDCPVEVIHGGEDRVCPPAAGQFLAEAISGAGPLRVIEGGSHAPFLTHRAAFAEALRAAIAAIRARD